MQLDVFMHTAVLDLEEGFRGFNPPFTFQIIMQWTMCVVLLLIKSSSEEALIFALYVCMCDQL